MNQGSQHRLIISYSLLACALTFLSMMATTSTSFAQSALKKLVVDEVKIVSGKRLYGIITEQSKNELTLFVERDWFKSSHPALYAKHLKQENDSESKNRLIHLKRLEQWKRQRMLEPSIAELVDEEVLRLKAENEGRPDNKKPTPTRFTVIRLKKNEITNLKIQSTNNHQIAGAAWKHNVNRVSSRTPNALLRELEKLNVDYTKEEIDFSNDVPISELATDEQWRARVAVFEHVLLEPCEFQGVGNNLVRIDRNNPNQDAAAMLQLFAGNLGGGSLGLFGGGALDDLMKELNLDGGPGEKAADSNWWRKAAEAAKKDGFRGVKVTRMISSLANPIVKVETWFIAEVETDEPWNRVFVGHGSFNRDHVEAAEVERIKADPQVQQLINVLDGFKLGNSNRLQTALRHGAATDLAMKKSESEFQLLLDRYTEFTDRPILKLYRK